MTRAITSTAIVAALCLFASSAPQLPGSFVATAAEASGKIVFFDTFTELAPPYKGLTTGHVPEMGLRWQADEDTSAGLMPPFIIYSGDVPRGKVAIPSVDSYNFTTPRPDGTSWRPSRAIRRSFLAVPAAPLSPDYTVQFNFREVNNSSTQDFWYITARRTTPGTFYGAGWYYGSVSPDCFIFKVIGGVYTELASGECDLMVDGHTVALRVQGDKLTLYRDGVEKLTAVGGGAITAAGAGGWGAGNIRRATDGFTEGESIDDFMLVDGGGPTAVPTPAPPPIAAAPAPSPITPAPAPAPVTPAPPPPPVIPPIVSAPVVVRPGDHGYFDALIARPDHWKSYSLRSAAMLDAYRYGWLKAQTYDPASDTYHSPQDAAKITVAPFIPQRRPDNNQPVTLSQPMGIADDVLQADWMAHGNGITYKVDGEVMGFVQKLTDPVTGRVSTRVSRGQHGTAPVAHAAGAEVWRSINATYSQIRLPMGTERGHSYLTTWDAWYGPETRSDRSGIAGWKNYQFAQGTGDGTLGLEVRSRMIESSSVVLAPDEVATVDMRAYLALGTAIGNEPITPRKEFRIKAATWTRYWVLLDHTTGEWDYLSLWMADVNRAPVQILDRIPYRPGSRSFAKFWLEFSSSNENLKPGRGPLVTYVRNVAMLRDVADPSSLLIRPSGAAPTAPKNLRVVH